MRLHRDSVFLFPIWVIGMEGVRFSWDLVRYSAACVTLSAGYSLGRAVLFGKSYFMLDTHSYAVLEMYYVRYM